MIEVTESAVEAIAEYFSAMKIKPIRIFVTQCCDGQQLGMALDKITDSDAVHHEGGFPFIMDRSLLDEAQLVHIDLSEMGFIISSDLELSGGCQSCGTACGCCGS